MGFLLSLSFKNLFRNKLRTFISVLAIAFAVMIVVFARGYIVGMIDSLFRDHIYYDSGHIKIVDTEYHNQKKLLPLNYPIDGFNGEGYENMVKTLNDINNVDMVIPRLKFGAMVSTPKELVSMMGWGVDPKKEVEFTKIDRQFVNGRMIEDGKKEVVMGVGLLDKLDKKVGDKVTILFNTAFGSLQGVTFKIVGSVKSGVKMINEIAFYLPLDIAQELLYMEGEVTEILLVTPDRKLTNTVLPDVKDIFKKEGAKKYLIQGYKDTSDLLPYMEMAKLIYNEIYVFLVILASIVVVNTMIMIVKERTREIGMMLALGLENGDIMKLFLIEGGIIGVVGSLVGAMAGSLIVKYYSVVGLDFSSATKGFSSDIIFSSLIYPTSSFGNTMFSFLLGTFLVILACIIPARKASKLEPTEAMMEL